MSSKLDAEAKALYESRDLIAPKWEQLGDVTKSVWRDYVRAGVKPEIKKPVVAKKKGRAR